MRARRLVRKDNIISKNILTALAFIISPLRIVTSAKPYKLYHIYNNVTARFFAQKRHRFRHSQYQPIKNIQYKYKLHKNEIK